MSIKICDLIKLVEACGKSGVKKFDHETEDGLPIHLEFHEQKLPPVIQKKEKIPLVVPAGPLEMSPEFETQEQLRLIEDDFDILPILDPMKYEELLANGKLDEYGEAHA